MKRLSGLCLMIGAMLGSPLSLANNHKITAFNEVGQGQPVILIHAFPTDHRLWQPQQDELKNHFRVITLDLPGFGQAPAVDGNAVTMAYNADYVKQLMDQ